MTPPPLVVRFGSLGDLVQSTVLLAALARASGRPCDLVTGHGQAPALLAGLASVGEVRLVASRRRPYLLSPDQRALVAWLRRRERSLACLVETVDAVRPKLRRLLARGGTHDADLLDAAELGRGRLEHTVDFLHRVAAAAVACLDGPPLPPRPPLPQLAVSDAERAECLDWLARHGCAGRPIVVVHPASRRTNRGRWPEERWAGVLRQLLAVEPEARVVLSGSAGESAEIAAVARAAADRRLLAAAGDLPLRRLVALLAFADSFVGLDSGPAHFAAAVGCPLVALFGRADPRRVAPRGAGSIEIVAALPRESWPDDPFTWQHLNRLEAIPVDAVAAAWRRLPRRGPPPAPGARA
ncbi:MAG TPA: glycosyltransferase family 9 protein [Thermoanaerobaculia bacterium]